MSPRATTTNVWQSTFNPGRNFNMAGKSLPRDYFDNVDDPKHAPSTWVR